MNYLKQIDKHYGETMVRLCREILPETLEDPEMLFKLLDENFNKDKQLAKDVIKMNLKFEFKEYLSNRIQNVKGAESDKSPQELLDSVGYELFKCETPEDIAQFEKYYDPNEVLCTFRDGVNGADRLKRNIIFWIVKKDIDKIKRAEEPRREDDYGVSCMSVQIPKCGRTISIKNRYNHSVPNCDATYGNNLDNIVPGLTHAFNREFNLQINSQTTDRFYPHNYVRAGDGKFYRYNQEHRNVYYCPNNIIIDNGEVKDFPKEKYTLMDTFILEKGKRPRMRKYDGDLENSFLENENLEDKKVKEVWKRERERERERESIWKYQLAMVLLLNWIRIMKLSVMKTTK